MMQRSTPVLPPANAIVNERGQWVVPCESSFLECFGYDLLTKLLVVSFKSGKQYLYYNVPEIEVRKFARNPTGGHYNDFIRGRYPRPVEE